MPSSSSVPSASISPQPQSMSVPASSMRMRSAYRRCTFGCGAKPSGRLAAAPATRCSVSAGTRVDALQSSPAHVMPFQTPPNEKTCCFGMKSRA